MSFKIVVDSCCDLTPAMLKDPVFVKVPLTIQSNGSTFVDDETFDQADLLWAMRQSEDAPTTSCPSPQAYLDAYRGADDVYVVTLSALLSGSHNSAEEILPRRCLARVTVAWPRMWLVGAEIRLALGVAAWRRW